MLMVNSNLNCGVLYGAEFIKETGLLVRPIYLTDRRLHHDCLNAQHFSCI